MKRHWLTGLMLTLVVGSAAHGASFDARRAPDIAAFIASHGASGALKKGDDGHTYFDGKAGNILFETHFQTCDEDRSHCRTMLLDALWDSKKITVDQVNRWNRWTLYCPAYLDKDGAPNIWYAIAVSANTNEDDLAGPLSTWMDCLHDFDSFVDGPDDFLAKHN